FRFDDEVIHLGKAGKTTVVFQAAAGNQKAPPQELVLDYDPPLPTAVRLDPEEFDAEAAGKVKFHCRLSGPERDLFKYNILEVLISKKKAADWQAAGKNGISVEASLEPGYNPVEVVLDNGYHKDTVLGNVYRKQPPQILSFDLPARPSGP